MCIYTYVYKWETENIQNLSDNNLKILVAYKNTLSFMNMLAKG